MNHNDEELPVLKFVIDSNVWINALTSCGNAKQYERARARSCIEKAMKNGEIIRNSYTTGDFENKLDQFVEAGRLFQRDVDIIKKEFHRMTKNISEKEENYVGKSHRELAKCCEDRKDWCFLILADTEKAFVIVSGDEHLLQANYKDIKVLTDRQFLVERLPAHQWPPRNRDVGEHRERPE